jgi:broad specificity phosphatase PhoE
MSFVAVALVYETHSTTTDNEQGVATGWLPGELSERGRELASELGSRRRGDGIDVVFTSDLRRAVETVEIAFRGSEIPIRQDARLRECNYGELNGMPLGRLEQERLQRVNHPFPGGESYLDVVERTRSFLAKLLRHHDGRRLLLVAHSANRWALDHLINGEVLDELIGRDFEWQPGWQYELTDLPR